jgi:hypothetical protein
MRALFVGGPWHGYRMTEQWSRADLPSSFTFAMPVRMDAASFTDSQVPDMRTPIAVNYSLASKWREGMGGSVIPVYVAPGGERYGQGPISGDSSTYDRSLADALLERMAPDSIPTCIVPDCGERAPQLFIADAYGRLAGRDLLPDDEIRLCVPHGSDLYQAQHVRGVDRLAEWLRPDAMLDPIDAFGVGPLFQDEVLRSEGKALRVRREAP